MLDLKYKSHGDRYKIDLDRPVKVYWNLHRKCFSVQQDGLVKAHMGRVWIDKPTFVVNEAGRQRVLREKRKNVHAFVIGKIEGKVNPTRQSFVVKYNPYKFDSFVNANTEEKVEGGRLAKLDGMNTIPKMKVFV